MMFDPGFVTSAPPGASSVIVHVRGATVAIEEAPLPEHGHVLGTLDGRPCVALEEIDDRVEVDSFEVADVNGEEEGWVRSDSVRFVGLRELWGEVEEPIWALAGRAVQVVAWDRTHRFCGRCGQATRPLPDERARQCPRCGLTAYPRLAPAVIVLVERADGRALLARNASFPEAFYSCLAGFVEPGETLEEAARREVREEVGIELQNLRYFGSQPWPFPHSLMIGFEAELASGEIRPDGREILEAAWFSPLDLPRLPGEISIARALIDAWRRRSCQPVEGRGEVDGGPA